jgi:hypothetical protein
MEFTNLSIEEFNNIYGVATTREMNIEEFTEYIESQGVDYMYASFDSKDVSREYKEFLEEVGHECDLVCIIETELFLAMY